MRRHKSTPPQNAPATAHDVEPIDDTLRQAEPAWVLELACCCPSRPAVRVIMPATAERPPAELLLCGHHYRTSSDRLVEAGASVYDRAGALIASGAPVG